MTNNVSSIDLEAQRVTASQEDIRVTSQLRRAVEARMESLAIIRSRPSILSQASIKE